MFAHFIEQLKTRLQQPLPGEDVQFRMAPITRQRINPVLTKNYNPIKSAVLVLLFPIEKNIHTLFIQRTVYKGVHSAQIAFPGGKLEESDSDLKQTALRETHEEIGIDPQQINIIGKLTDVYITPSNYLVTPYIGYMNGIVDFDIDTREVEKVILTDFFKLNNSSIKYEKSIIHSDGNKIKTPYYEVEGVIVWGATAMMISELNVIAEESKTIIL